ncbi:MAG: CRISPR system precrRNA processing endoribonuclease RAMP protein Cas6 [Desulfococcaceae bacterium]
MDFPEYNDLFAPLFSLPVSRIRIRFSAREEWKIFGRETALRGLMGMNLRRLCCPFPEFRKKDCEVCELADNCLYIRLFSPLSLPEKTGEGKSLQRHPVRPFVPALDGDSNEYFLEPGQKGTAALTLFGPAISYCSLFMEAAVSALSVFPLQVEDIRILSPCAAQGENPDALAFPLAEWIHRPPDPFPERKGSPSSRFISPSLQESGAGGSGSQENIARLHLRMITPVRLFNDNSLKNIDFSIIVQAIVRRLRDLKRRFGEGSDMGRAEESFYHAVKKVGTVHNDLHWSKRERYSRRQSRGVSLSGFRGNIIFQGPVQAFYPLLKAAEIVHVGKGTSGGCGRVELVG